MSPTALAVEGHHDSFTLPSSQVIRGDGKVHTSAKRSPEGGLIKVEGEGTSYEEEGIRAKFTDRGAHVSSQLSFDPSQRYP